MCIYIHIHLSLSLYIYIYIIFTGWSFAGNTFSISTPANQLFKQTHTNAALPNKGKHPNES